MRASAHDGRLRVRLGWDGQFEEDSGIANAQNVIRVTFAKLKSDIELADTRYMSYEDEFPLVPGVASVRSSTTPSGGASGFAVVGQQQWDVICREIEARRAEAHRRQREIGMLTRMMLDDELR